MVMVAEIFLKNAIFLLENMNFIINIKYCQLLLLKLRAYLKKIIFPKVWINIVHLSVALLHKMTFYDKNSYFSSELKKSCKCLFSYMFINNTVALCIFSILSHVTWKRCLKMVIWKGLRFNQINNLYCFMEGGLK